MDGRNLPGGVLDLFRLDGQVAIVTGAARGLGQAIALGLASAGADLALVDVLSVGATAEAVADLGVQVHEIRTDLLELDPAGAAELMAEVEAAQET